MRKLAVFAATGFGLGLSPVAPGTVGSLLGCLIVWIMTALRLPLAGQIAVCVLLAFVCVPVCTAAEKELSLGKDPGRIVADEYLTFPIAMLGLYGEWMQHAWLMPLCFAVARFMDIVKPFPAYRLQSLPSGLGITIDDLVASLYALAVNHIIFAAAMRWG